MVRCTSSSSNLRPIKRLIEKIVFSGLTIAWFRAVRPTTRSPFLLMATTEGHKRSPSAVGMTVGSPPDMTATTELVVPRSIPIIFPIFLLLFCDSHLRRAYNPFTDGVALLDYFDNKSAFHFRIIFMRDCLMQCRIKSKPFSGNWLNTFPVEEI